MPSSEMLRRVTLVRTDVSEECIAYIISVDRFLSPLGSQRGCTSRRVEKIASYNGISIVVSVTVEI
jgi:hypothetical protein